VILGRLQFKMIEEFHLISVGSLEKIHGNLWEGKKLRRFLGFLEKVSI
jgi:hypothetical protein